MGRDSRYADNGGERMKYMFTAKWCNQCQIMKPMIEKIKDIKIIDIDERPELVKKYTIMSLPTFLIDDESGIRFKTGVFPSKIIEDFYE